MSHQITTKLSQLSGHSGPVYCLQQGRFEHTVFSGGADGFVAEWDMEQFAPSKFSVKLDAPVFSICKIPATTQLVIGLFNGHIHVIDWESKQEIKHMAMKTKGVFSLCFDPSIGLLYSGGGDGVLNVWNPQTWELVLSLPLTEKKIRHIAVEKGHIYVSCGDGILRVLENVFFNETFSFEAHADGIYCSLPSENILYTAGKDAHIKIWDPKTMALLESIPAHNYAIYSLVAWEPGLLATASRDKTIKLWNPNDWAHPIRIDHHSYRAHQRSVNALYVCEWNKSLISAGDDGKLMVWAHPNNVEVE